MRILVTGGAGFIGSHIVDWLIARGDTALVVDDLSTGRASNLSPAVDLVEVDVASPKFLGVAMDFRPHVVVHCAAQPSVVVSMSDPVHDAATNILGGINVARAAVASGCQQLTYLNTGGALYGHAQYLPLDEDHPIQPMSAYGLSKWTLECYLKLLLPEWLPLKVLRLANVYGPRQDPFGEAGVIAIFAGCIVRGERVTIFGDGEQTRDFVYVGDVVRAHGLAMQYPRSLTVNIGSAVGVSVNELLSIMAAQTGYPVTSVHEAERAGEIRHSVLDNSRAKNLLGWVPEILLEAGVRATLDDIHSREAPPVPTGTHPEHQVTP